MCDLSNLSSLNRHGFIVSAHMYVYAFITNPYETLYDASFSTKPASTDLEDTPCDPHGGGRGRGYEHRFDLSTCYFDYY